MVKNKEDIKRIEDLKKLNALYRKYKKGLKARYDLAPFNEPVLQLERTNGTIEFYDKAIAGVYTFEHTDGTHRHLTLKGFPKTMKFYDQTIKVWTCHEDFPFQIPENPLVTSELFTQSKDKDLNDTKNYKAQIINAKSKMIYQMLIGIAIVIAVIILGKMMLPNLFSGAKNVAPAVVETVKNNTTAIISKNITIV